MNPIAALECRLALRNGCKVSCDGHDREPRPTDSEPISVGRRANARCANSPKTAVLRCSAQDGPSQSWLDLSQSPTGLLLSGPSAPGSATSAKVAGLPS